jgi:hypothetical protein
VVVSIEPIAVIVIVGITPVLRPPAILSLLLSLLFFELHVTAFTAFWLLGDPSLEEILLRGYSKDKFFIAIHTDEDLVIQRPFFHASPHPWD